jgi:hypothetical protein
MINLRKFRHMYNLILDALNMTQIPYSYWYKLFPEDSQFPAHPIIDGEALKNWKEMRDCIEGEIQGCWAGDCAQGNWERSLHVKKILASAGF